MASCYPKPVLYKPADSSNTRPVQHARLAAFWTVAGVLGTLAVFPYALAINPAVAAQLPVPLPALVAAQTAQTGILLLLLSWIGLRLGQPLGLDSPFARALAGRQKVTAAPAALERKHPVDARQLLRPQISRRVSAPRLLVIRQRQHKPYRALPQHRQQRALRIHCTAHLQCAPGCQVLDHRVGIVGQRQ